MYYTLLYVLLLILWHLMINYPNSLLSSVMQHLRSYVIPRWCKAASKGHKWIKKKLVLSKTIIKKILHPLSVATESKNFFATKLNSDSEHGRKDEFDLCTRISRTGMRPFFWPVTADAVSFFCSITVFFCENMSSVESVQVSLRVLFGDRGGSLCPRCRVSSAGMWEVYAIRKNTSDSFCWECYICRKQFNDTAGQFLFSVFAMWHFNLK